MSSGKRYSTSEPLTEHDVAERLTKSMVRTWTILLQTREAGIKEAVLQSRYLGGGVIESLYEELGRWLPENDEQGLAEK